MKYFFTIIFSGFITLQSFAFKKGGEKQWLVIGARGTFNSTWLLSQNQLNDKGIKYKASWGAQAD